MFRNVTASRSICTPGVGNILYCCSTLNSTSVCSTIFTPQLISWGFLSAFGEEEFENAVIIIFSGGKLFVESHQKSQIYFQSTAQKITHKIPQILWTKQHNNTWREGVRLHLNEKFFSRSHMKKYIFRLGAATAKTRPILFLSLKLMQKNPKHNLKHKTG